MNESISKFVRRKLRMPLTKLVLISGISRRTFYRMWEDGRDHEVKALVRKVYREMYDEL